MANEIPQSKDWHEIFEILSDENYRKVEDKRIELQYQEEEARKAAMTEEEKAKEAAIWKKIKEDPEPKFYGNMGEPETPEEFKRKYGYDPRGADYNKALIDAMRNRAHSLLIRMKGKNGKIIEELSTLPKEKEILFQSGTKFKVNKVDYSANPNDDYMTKIRTVWLEEL